jgi:hypothetical protein
MILVVRLAQLTDRHGTFIDPSEHNELQLTKKCEDCTSEQKN